MSRPVKALIEHDLRDRYSGIDSVCVVDLAGLDVQEQEQLRRALREKSGRLEVVKNSLARRAFQDGVLEPLGAALDGPCALVTAPDSVIDVAKVLVQAAKGFAELGLKQAMVGGDPELLSVVDVASMKSHVELVGEVAMLVASPGRAVAGCLSSPQSKVAGCLKAIVDKAA